MYLDLCDGEESKLDGNGSADGEESSGEGDEVMELVLPLSLDHDGRLFLGVVVYRVGDDVDFLRGGEFGGEGSRAMDACLEAPDDPSLRTVKRRRRISRNGE